MKNPKWLGNDGVYYAWFPSVRSCCCVELDGSWVTYRVFCPTDDTVVSGMKTVVSGMTRDDAFDYAEAKMKKLAEMHKECSQYEGL